MRLRGVALLVWLYWGIITVQMLNLGFPFEKPELFTLSAVAGLTGATLRIPSTFFIRIAGGRNTIFLTTVLLVIPAVGTGLALRDPGTPLWQFQILAFLSGIGGGNFASSMSNISFFFPKRVQGYALGMNAGLGNFGVTTMQILVPLVMTMSVFGGEPLVLQNTSGTLIGKIPAGSHTWIHNAGFVWLVFLIPLGFATWLGMNNIPFLLLFLVLFAATGIGNGSTFRTIAVVFDREQAGPVLGWTSAVAAYGAFVIPKVFGEQIRATTPEYALYGFALFYAICIVVNWWFYLRPNAYVRNP